MPRLDEIRTDYEDQADDLRQLGDEELAAEMEQRALNIDNAIRETRTATTANLANADVRNLGGDTAGLYTLSSKEIALDPTALIDPETTLQVGIHEGMHYKNKVNGDNEVIADVDFEEALTESATARVTGEVRAYLDLVPMVGEVADATDHTRDELLNLFEAGKNAELNALYQKAVNDDVEIIQAAA